MLDFTDMAKLRNIEADHQGKFRAHARHHLPRELGQKASRPSWLRCAPRRWMPIKGGKNILIISDRNVSATQVAIPALLAPRPSTSTWCAKVAHHRRPGGRGDRPAREVHHFAVLAGYGAEAVHPYLAMETLQAIHKDLPGELSAEKAIYNYVKAIGKGLSKIMSKMGVSTYMSHCGAQLFEAIGLDSEPSTKYFTGTPTRVEGIGVFDIAEEAIRTHKAAFGDDPVLANMLDAGGEYAWRARGESTSGRPTRSPSCSTRPAPTTGTPTRNTPRSSTTRASAT